MRRTAVDFEHVRSVATSCGWYVAHMVPADMPHFHHPTRGMLILTAAKFERFEYRATSHGDQLVRTECTRMNRRALRRAYDVLQA